MEKNDRAAEQEQHMRRSFLKMASTGNGRRLLEAGLDAIGMKALTKVETAPFPGTWDDAMRDGAREAVILDVETTGLDFETDGVIQLSMVKVLHDDERILALGDRFNRYRDPGQPIPALITDLTRITDDMVAGRTISDGEITDWTADAGMIVAHNAAFDRKMCEANFPAAGFRDLRWDCSLEQVDWDGRGMRGAKLELLALRQGMVYGSHDASSDILALAHVLNGPGGGGAAPFSEMVRRGTIGQIHVIAEGAPFEVKDALKARGYFWTGAGEGQKVCGHDKVWSRIIDASPEAVDAEAAFLRDDIYRREKSVPAYRLSGTSRYSTRAGGDRFSFDTTAATKVAEFLAMRQNVEASDKFAMGF